METEDGLDPDLLDPCPDIYALFCHYNDLYFEGSLGACSVQWSSKRMTLCAGTCSFQNGGGCIIRLSEPLLKFRPPKDLKETLLHEMIHAKIFLTSTVRDHNDHGPQFQAIMKGINQSTTEDHQRPFGGYDIGIYHTFRDEVQHHRRHHWTCEKCGHEIQRAMNRNPSPSDCRLRPPLGSDCGDARCLWHTHEKSCGGAFVKTAEPEGYQNRGKKRKGGEVEAGSKEGEKRKEGRKGGSLDTWVVKKDTADADVSARDAAAQAAEDRWQQASKTRGEGSPEEEGEGKKRQKTGKGWAAVKKEVGGENVLVDLEKDADWESFEVLEPGSKVGATKDRIKREEGNLAEIPPITKFFRKRESAEDERAAKALRLDLSPAKQIKNERLPNAEGPRLKDTCQPSVDEDEWETFPEEQTSDQDEPTQSAELPGAKQLRSLEELMKRSVPAGSGSEGLEEMPKIDTSKQPPARLLPEEEACVKKRVRAPSSSMGEEELPEALEKTPSEESASQTESDPEWTDKDQNKRTRWTRKAAVGKRGSKKVVLEDSDSDDLLELDARPASSNENIDGKTDGEEDFRGEEGQEAQGQKGIRKYFLRKGATKERDSAKGAAQTAGMLQYTRRGKKRKRASSPGGVVEIEKVVDPDWRGAERYVFEATKEGGAEESEAEWQRRLRWMQELEDQSESGEKLQTKRRRKTKARGSSELDGGAAWGNKRRRTDSPKESVSLAEEEAVKGTPKKADVAESLAALHLKGEAPKDQEAGPSNQRELTSIPSASLDAAVGLFGTSKCDENREKPLEQATSRPNRPVRGAAKRTEIKIGRSTITEEALLAAARSSESEELGELTILPAVETQSQGYNRSRRVLPVSSEKVAESQVEGLATRVATETENSGGPSDASTRCPICDKVFPGGMPDNELNAHVNACLDQTA